MLDVLYQRNGEPDPTPPVFEADRVYSPVKTREELISVINATIGHSYGNIDELRVYIGAVSYAANGDLSDNYPYPIPGLDESSPAERYVDILSGLLNKKEDSEEWAAFSIAARYTDDSYEISRLYGCATLCVMVKYALSPRDSLADFEKYLDEILTGLLDDNKNDLFSTFDILRFILFVDAEIPVDPPSIPPENYLKYGFRKRNLVIRHLNDLIFKQQYDLLVSIAGLLGMPKSYSMGYGYSAGVRARDHILNRMYTEHCPLPKMLSDDQTPSDLFMIFKEVVPEFSEYLDQNGFDQSNTNVDELTYLFQSFFFDGYVVDVDPSYKTPIEFGKANISGSIRVHSESVEALCLPKSTVSIPIKEPLLETH